MSKQYRIFVQRSLKFFLVLFISFDGFSADEIKINDLLNNIEVVSNSNERRKGLMFRKSLPEMTACSLFGIIKRDNACG